MSAPVHVKAKVVANNGTAVRVKAHVVSVPLAGEIGGEVRSMLLSMPRSSCQDPRAVARATVPGSPFHSVSSIAEEYLPYTW